MAETLVVATCLEGEIFRSLICDLIHIVGSWRGFVWAEIVFPTHG